MPFWAVTDVCRWVSSMALTMRLFLLGCAPCRVGVSFFALIRMGGSSIVGAIVGLIAKASLAEQSHSCAGPGTYRTGAPACALVGAQDADSNGSGRD
jgi:hypothetical protein